MRRIQKFVLISAVLAVCLFAGNPQSAKAMTISEMQVLIQQLIQQITQLQRQLAEIQKQPAVWCHDFNVNIKWKDRGEQVKALHTVLEKEGFKIADDEKARNYFYLTTLKAVMAFQEKYKADISRYAGYEIDATGFVGKGTRAKLNEQYGCKRPAPPKQPPEELPERPVKPYITLISPNGGERWVAGKTYPIQWNQKGLEKWGNKVDICLIGLDITEKAISAKENWRWSPCSYALSSGGLASYLIARTTLTTGKYDWTIPPDIAKRFEFVPNNYKISLLVFDNLPPEGRTEWGGLIGRDESDNYFSIVEEKELLPIPAGWDVSIRFDKAHCNDFYPFSEKAGKVGTTYYARLDGSSDYLYKEYYGAEACLEGGCRIWLGPLYEKEKAVRMGPWVAERKYIDKDIYLIRIRGASKPDCVCGGDGYVQGELNINPNSGWKIVGVVKCTTNEDTRGREVYCKVNEKTGNIKFAGGSACGGCCCCIDSAQIDIAVSLVK